jgi:thiol:disulfide interchange protein
MATNFDVDKLLAIGNSMMDHNCSVDEKKRGEKAKQEFLRDILAVASRSMEKSTEIRLMRAEIQLRDMASRKDAFASVYNEFWEELGSIREEPDEEAAGALIETLLAPAEDRFAEADDQYKTGLRNADGRDIEANWSCVSAVVQAAMRYIVALDGILNVRPETAVKKQPSAMKKRAKAAEKKVQELLNEIDWLTKAEAKANSLERSNAKWRAFAEKRVQEQLKEIDALTKSNAKAYDQAKANAKARVKAEKRVQEQLKEIDALTKSNAKAYDQAKANAKARVKADREWRSLCLGVMGALMICLIVWSV